jgi:hypothetical protein
MSWHHALRNKTGNSPIIHKWMMVCYPTPIACRKSQNRSRTAFHATSLSQGSAFEDYYLLDPVDSVCGSGHFAHAISSGTLKSYFPQYRQQQQNGDNNDTTYTAWRSSDTFLVVLFKNQGDGRGRCLAGSTPQLAVNSPNTSWVNWWYTNMASLPLMPRFLHSLTNGLTYTAYEIQM